jgi:hypothetical protein
MQQPDRIGAAGFGSRGITAPDSPAALRPGYPTWSRALAVPFSPHDRRITMVVLLCYDVVACRYYLKGRCLGSGLGVSYSTPRFPGLFREQSSPGKGIKRSIKVSRKSYKCSTRLLIEYCLAFEWYKLFSTFYRVWIPYTRSLLAG